MKSPRSDRSFSASDPEWYKDAILYEVRVRSFYDASGDGIGDFQGLTSKLDYLQDLGITALWLLPFYPSPLRDDGYDISDYTGVHPECGTIEDFKVFLEEAHRRGLRVITELVLNHTSDQHPWFQRARRAAPGSPEREMYVFSDTLDRYQDARIIFKDFEPSNWSWDPVARAYYWHRFYAHQPDLNFENPAVHDALLGVVDFWFEMGVDGLRLDAVPYLYEREGTTSENLPETHAFLKKLRRHVDERFADRMLLAEANQWPEDAAAYFGDGDECHMAFHFPIMPRLFMAIHSEDRFPVVDILAQTPQPAPSCQWALFLRNHDELTLEMVTDEERDYMYRAYARDAQMRINLGIRRRLAPLLGNDRRLVELMKALLFALPGTPVLYYGDEIGMGDNVFLGDRNGVRTPMQWSSDRNAGFSRANPQRLILPVIVDPEYHFESVNVEAQQGNPSSLLWWMKRLIALRKRFLAFGRGTIEVLSPENHRVLAFIRRHGDEVILLVANLSRFTELVEIDLSREKGLIPIELFGGNALPPIRETPYPLTLGGHGFYLFALTPDHRAEDLSLAEGYRPPVVEVHGPWDRGVDRPRLAALLSGYLNARPWFVRRGRAPLRIVEAIPLGEGKGPPLLAIVAVDHDRGEAERYVIPIAFEAAERANAIRARSPQAIIAEISAQTDAGPVQGVLLDAFADNEAARSILELLVGRGAVRGASGEVVARGFSAPAPREDLPIEPRSGRLGPQSSFVLFGEPFFLKLFRRLDEGKSPDLEIAEALAAQPPIPGAPRLAGCVEYRPDRGEPVTLAVLRAHAVNDGDAFSRGVEEASRALQRALTQRRDEPLAPEKRSPLALAAEGPPPMVRELVGSYLESAELLGRRTAEIHLALANRALPAAFNLEPTTVFDQRSTYQTMRNRAGKVLRALRQRIRAIPAPAVPIAEAILARETELYDRFGAVLKGRLTAQKARLHGDYHLGHALFTGRDFLVVDFEGDPKRPLSDRRRKGSVLSDLASMIHSFRAAALTALLDESRVRHEDRASLAPFADLWATWVSAAFLRGYLAVAGDAPFFPRDRREAATLLDAFLLETALGDLGRAIEDAPGRAGTALLGLRAALDAGQPGRE